MKPSSNLNTFLYIKPITDNFGDIPHPYKLFASKYMRDDLMFLLEFFIYLLFASSYLCIIA